jgi:hypothetical protein
MKISSRNFARFGAFGRKISSCNKRAFQIRISVEQKNKGGGLDVLLQHLNVSSAEGEIMALIKVPASAAGIGSVVQPVVPDTAAVASDDKPTIAQTPRLTIRGDEGARRVSADTDGALRRARAVAETNRLI